MITASDLREIHLRLFNVGESNTPPADFDLDAATKALTKTPPAGAIPSEVKNVVDVVIGTLVGIVSNPPIASGADRLALFAASTAAQLSGSALELEPADPMFLRIHEELMQHGSLSTNSRGFLEGRLVAVAAASSEIEQLALFAEPAAENSPQVPNLESGPNAYIATALTCASPDDLKAIERRSEVVAQVLASRGVSVHQPAIHTHPHKHSSLPPFKVYEIDHAHVLNSDAFVMLADTPSFGAGMELVWAMGSRTEIAVLAAEDTDVSKLLEAATGRVTVLRYRTDSDLREVVARWADEHSRGMERARANRLQREVDLRDEWIYLRAEVRSVGLCEESAEYASMSITRIQEIRKSPSHFAAATRDELQGVSLYVDRARELAARPKAAPTETRNGINRSQLEALEDAAELYGWSVGEVAELYREAERLLQLEGVHRITLRTPLDWLNLRSERRDG